MSPNLFSQHNLIKSFEFFKTHTTLTLRLIERITTLLMNFALIPLLTLPEFLNHLNVMTKTNWQVKTTYSEIGNSLIYCFYQILSLHACDNNFSF